MQLFSLRLYFYCLVSLFVTIPAYAQPASGLSYSSPDYDFGQISEDDGIRYHHFGFVNKSGRPIVIREVRSSCGCTRPEFDRKIIEPEESGSIRVGYDPLGYPGDFLRQLIVVHSGGTDTLTIRGNTQKSSIERCPGYRYRHGDLCLKREKVMLRNFDPKRVREDNILIKNTSDSDMTLHFIGLSESFTLYTEPKVLQPGSEGELIIRYTPDKKQQPAAETVFEVWHISREKEQNLFDLKIIL